MIIEKTPTSTEKRKKEKKIIKIIARHKTFYNSRKKLAIGQVSKLRTTKK